MVSHHYTEQELECMQNDLSNSKRKLNDNNAINLVEEESCHKACNNAIGDILKGIFELTILHFTTAWARKFLVPFKLEREIN